LAFLQGLCSPYLLWINTCKLATPLYRRFPRTHPSANTFCITFGCKFTGRTLFIPTKEPLKIRAEELQPFFSSHEMPVLVLSYKLEPYLSVFQTPKGVLKLQLEKQGLKKVLDEQQLKPWEATKVGIEIISSGQTINLKALTD